MKYSQDQIKAIVLKEKSVRISFTNDRHPMFGKLVMLSDGQDLLDKKFVRFVRESDVQMFEGTHPIQMYDQNQHIKGSVNLTKLFSITDFEMITEYGS